MRAFKPFPSAKICICLRITAPCSAISLKKLHLKTSDSKRIINRGELIKSLYSVTCRIITHVVDLWHVPYRRDDLHSNWHSYAHACC